MICALPRPENLPRHPQRPLYGCGVLQWRPYAALCNHPSARGCSKFVAPLLATLQACRRLEHLPHCNVQGQAMARHGIK